MRRKNIITGLELGSTRIAMVAAEVRNGGLDILAASKLNCPDGINNGTIIDLDSTTETIVKLTEALSQKISRQINSVFINVGGINLKREIANPVIMLPQRGCEINQRHLKDLLDSCKRVSIPLDRHLLHLSALEYIVDGQEGIRNPIGLYGNKLEARVLMITAPLNQVQNIRKAVNYAGLEIEELILTAMADGYAVLSDEEKRQGVLLADFKKDFIEVSIFKGGGLLFFEAIRLNQCLAERLDAILNEFDNTITSGVAITGGYVSMESFSKLTGERLRFPVREGFLNGGPVFLDKEDYAVPMGLIRVGLLKRQRVDKWGNGGGIFRRVLEKADAILTDYF